MPSINVPISPQGPVVELYVGVSSARLLAVKAAGLPDPQLHMVRLLLDTGASSTNICSSIMSKMGMPPTGQVQVFTPSTGNTPVSMEQYDVNLYFPFPGKNLPPHTIATVPIICAEFQAQGIHGLIGRDILSKAGFVYHGDLNFCVLNF